MIVDIGTLFIKRLGQSIFVVLIVGLLSFALFRYIGDPILGMTNIVETSPEEIEQLKESLGLNKPFYIQYFNYIKNIVLHADFGNSYQYKMSVIKLIGGRVSATFELAFLAFGLAFILGIIVGTYTAIHPNKWFSHGTTFMSSVGMSTPSFIVGLFLIYVFTVNIPILPTFGRGETIQIGIWKSNLFSVRGFKHLILPVMTLFIYQFAFIIRVVRSEVSSMLQSEFVRYAYLRGLKNKRIYFVHVLKNILPQLMSIVLLRFGGLVAFSSITESVFQWQGLGLLFIESLQQADIPVLSTYLMLIAVFFVILNFIADAIQIIIDPRVRRSML